MENVYPSLLVKQNLFKCQFRIQFKKVWPSVRFPPFLDYVKVRVMQKDSHGCKVITDDTHISFTEKGGIYMYSRWIL